MQILQIVFLFALILQTTIGGKDGDKSAGQSSSQPRENPSVSSPDLVLSLAPSPHGRSHAAEEQPESVQVPHNIASQQVYSDLDLSMALPEIHHAAGEQPPPPVRPNLGKSPTGIRDRGKNIVPEGSEPSPKTSKPKKRKLMQEAIDEGTEILDYSEETKTYKKHMPTKEQRKYLEDYFAQKEILESGEKEEIAKKIGFTPRQVEVWFQNRRARSKLYTHQQMGEWLDALQHENAYLQQVNHSLFAENQMLRARIHHLENPNVPPQHHIVQHQPQQIDQYHQQPPQLILPQRLPKRKKGGEGSSAAGDSPASRKGKGI